MANIAEVRNKGIRLRRASAALAGLVVFGLALVALPSAKAQTPVLGAGSFNLAGAIDVTSTAFTFGSMSTPPPGDEMARTTLPLTGAFSGMTSGANVQVRNLTAAGDVTPGTPFNFTNWIDLSRAGAAIRLDLNNITVNPTLGVCSAADDAPGSICKPYATSPITLEQGYRWRYRSHEPVWSCILYLFPFHYDSLDWEAGR